MELANDFKELLECLSARRVEFLVVGGYALAHYGAPRMTGDLDILIRPEPANALRTLEAIHAFGFRPSDFDASDLAKPGVIIQIGRPPVRVDVITSIDGVSWEDAWSGKSKGVLGGLPLFFIGRREFIANKRAVGRRRDLADLESLGEET